MNAADHAARNPQLAAVALILTIVGAITLTYMAWMVVASFLYPAVGGGINATKLYVLAGLVVSGLLVFYGARAYRLRREGIDIKVVGLITLAQAPWSFKFLWAPLMDRYAPPLPGCDPQRISIPAASALRQEATCAWQ